MNSEPQPPFLWEGDPVPIAWEARWTLGPVWTLKQEKNLVPTGIRTQDHRTLGLVAILTAPSWFLPLNYAGPRK
jgi:hypothetical protein